MHTKKTKIIQMLLIYTDSQPLYNAQKKTKEHINVTDIHQQSTTLQCTKNKEHINVTEIHQQSTTIQCTKNKKYTNVTDTPAVNHYTMHKKTKSV